MKILIVLIGLVALTGCNEQQRAHEKWLTQQAHNHELAKIDRANQQERWIKHQSIEAAKEKFTIVVTEVGEHVPLTIKAVAGVGSLWITWLAVNGLYFRFEDGRERRGRFNAACKLIESLPDCSEKRAAIAELAQAKNVLQLSYDERRAA